MSGIFHPDHYAWDAMGLHIIEIRRLDRELDRYLLEYLAAHWPERCGKMAMRVLGISKPPERKVNLEDRNDEDYETYLVLREQVEREPDAEILKECAFEGPRQMRTFAFCRLTKYVYPWQRCDAYSYHIYDCGWKEGMTPEDVREFCREMIDARGPFMKEAAECLENLPSDHNDYDGRRMRNVERPMTEPVYARQKRRALYQTEEEYAQGRAEIARLERLALSMIGNPAEVTEVFCALRQMLDLAAKMLEFIDTPEVRFDYARACVIMADLSNTPEKAEEALKILRELSSRFPGESAYADQLRKAETVYERLREKYGL